MAAKGCLAAVAQGVLRPLALGRGRVRPLVFRLDRAVRCKQGENERIRMKRRKSEKNKVEKKASRGIIDLSYLFIYYEELFTKRFIKTVSSSLAKLLMQLK